MKNLKTWHIVVIAVIFLLLVAIGLFWSKIKLLWKPKTPAQTITTTIPEDKPQLDFNKVLKLGVYDSPEVKLLQEWLGGLAVDGDFGPLTEEALRERIHFSETTLANFQRLVSNEASDVNNTGINIWNQEDDNPIGYSILNPFTWFND